MKPNIHLTKPKLQGLPCVDIVHALKSCNAHVMSSDRAALEDFMVLRYLFSFCWWNSGVLSMEMHKLEVFSLITQ